MESDMVIYITKVSAIVGEFEQTELYNRLPEFRREAADRCGNRADRERSIAAGLLLGFCMQKRGVSFGETPCFTENGKMFFPREDKFYVNLSHGGDYAACALAPTDVGIDLEPVRRYRENVAKRICSAEEMQELLKEKKEEEQNRQFTKLWTRKESMAKLSGEGIAMLLGSRGRKEPLDSCIYTKTYTPAPDYFLSVSSHENDFPDRVILLSPESLVR